MFRFIKALILLLFFCLNFAWAQESKNIYFVDSIRTKAVGKNPNEARKISVNNARRDAFMVLLSRLKMPISLSDNISDSEIAEMVRSEQIVDEKIAGNSYSASFNIIFAKDFVDHILGKKNDNGTFINKNLDEKYSEKFTIIPVKMVNNRPIIWESENDWRVMMERIIAKNNFQKTFMVPNYNFENTSNINNKNIKDISFSNFERINADNGAEASYVLFFNFDEIENKVLIDVVYLRKLLKKQFRLSFINVDRLSYNDLILKVAEKTLEYLNNNPIGNDEILNNKFVNIHVKIEKLDDWLYIKKMIEDAKIVDKIFVNSISRDEVWANIIYLNSTVSIEQAFEKIGITIAKQSQGFYEINTITHEN